MLMNIKLEIMGPARRKIDKNPANLEIPEGSTVLNLMKKVGYSEKEAGFLVYVRGQQKLKLNSQLQPDDFIKAVLQAGGG